MQVREAGLSDKANWDAFVDNEGGSFFHYFDWKYVYESGKLQFIPLIIEDAQSRLTGILPIVKEDKAFCSTLRSCTTGQQEAGGLLLKRSLSGAESNNALAGVLEYVNKKLSKKCSSIRLVESDNSSDETASQPFITCGYRYIYDGSHQLPSNFILELKRPFEENVWQKLWSSKLRGEINRAERGDVVVIEDRDFSYLDVFISMLTENCLRHGTPQPSRAEIVTRVETFKDKTKLFVALTDGLPSVAGLCHYTPSTCYLSKIGSWAKDTNNANKLCSKVIIADACDAGYSFADFGYAYDTSLALHKERYRTSRHPVKIYEKVFSLPRYFCEVSPRIIKGVWDDKEYLWKYRKKIWDVITH